MNQRLMIRPFVPDDLDDMMRIWRGATVVVHDFMTEADLDRDEEMIRGGMIDQTESWMACRDREIEGFISLMGRLIVALFVAPEFHRMGVGTRLIAHVNDLHGPMNVEVFKENVTGVAFYRKNGFEFVREEPNPFYDRPQIIMAQPGAPEASRPSD